MNNELHSLPEALAAELRQLTSSLAPQPQSSELSIGERLGKPIQQAEPAMNRALLHVAQASPELLVAVLLAHAGITSIELVESEETCEDKVVTLMNGGYSSMEVHPMVKRKTISRSVRLGTGDRATIGRLR